MKNIRKNIKTYLSAVFGAIYIQYQLECPVPWLNIITMIIGEVVIIYLTQYIVKEKQRGEKIINLITYGFVFAMIPLCCDSFFLPNDISNLLYVLMTVLMLVFDRSCDTDTSLFKRQWWEYIFITVFTFIFWAETIFQNYLMASIMPTISLLILLWIWSQKFYDFLVLFIDVVVNIHKNRIMQLKKYSERRIWLTVFLIMFIIGLFMSIVHHPGVIVPDMMSQWIESHGLGHLENRRDYMSFAYTCFFAIFTHFTDDFYPITFVCVTFYAAMWAFMMSFLCKRGLSFRGVICTTFFWVLIPINLVFISAAWKDIPYSLCVMGLGTILCKVWLDTESTWLDNIWLILTFIGTALLRSSGIIVSVFSMIVFLWLMHKEKKLSKGHITAGLMLISLVLIIKGPLYSSIGVDRGPEGFSALPFLDAVWENVYSQNSLPQNVEEYLTNIMPIDEFQNGYIEAYTNAWAIPGGYGNLDFGASVKAFLSCLKEYPGTTILARLKRTYNLWAFFPDTRFLVNNNYNLSIEYFSEPYGWSYPVAFTKIREWLLGAVAGRTLWEQFCLIINRAGISLVLFLGLLHNLIKTHRKSAVLIILPALLNHVTLLIGCCYPDYRYSYPFIISMIPFTLYVLTENGMNRDEQNVLI